MKVEQVAEHLHLNPNCFSYKSYFLKLYKMYTGQPPVKSKGEKL
ncbi:hypothetical protein [Paenibacillus wulumuqiensis]|nr:hypothetical protein [Paenibacillus wulumuqiensis]